MHVYWILYEIRIHSEISVVRTPHKHVEITKFNFRVVNVNDEPAVSFLLNIYFTRCAQFIFIRAIEVKNINNQ